MLLVVWSPKEVTTVPGAHDVGDRPLDARLVAAFKGVSFAPSGRGLPTHFPDPLPCTYSYTTAVRGRDWPARLLGAAFF